MREYIRQIRETLDLAEAQETDEHDTAYLDRIQALARRGIGSRGATPTPDSEPLPPCPGCHP